MVEETIRTIRETEKKADALVKEAEKKAAQIREDAKAEAAEAAEAIVREARGRAQNLADQSEQEGNMAEQEFLAKTETEVQAMRDSAIAREKEAVDLVISLLAV